jgi:hypothetical protein
VWTEADFDRYCRAAKREEVKAGSEKSEVGRVEAFPKKRTADFGGCVQGYFLL